MSWMTVSLAGTRPEARKQVTEYIKIDKLLKQPKREYRIEPLPTKNGFAIQLKTR